MNVYLNTRISIDRFYKDNKAEFESCTLQAEAEMDDLTLLQQQQQDLERQKLVSAMAAGIQWSLLRDLLTLLFYSHCAGAVTKHGCVFCSYFTCYPDCLSCMQIDAMFLPVNFGSLQVLCHFYVKIALKS